MKKSIDLKNIEISTSDHLALARTKLANERTFLAYFRTFAVLFSSGFALTKIEALHDLYELGYLFIVASISIIFIGITRFLFVRITIRKLLNK
jgi:putative membrane protein